MRESRVEQQHRESVLVYRWLLTSSSGWEVSEVTKNRSEVGSRGVCYANGTRGRE